MCSSANRAHNVATGAGNAFFVAQDCHPQTIEVVRTRAFPFGIEVIVGNSETFDPGKQKIFGALLQYPSTDGHVRDLPESADEIPDEIRKKKWGRLGVDTDGDFTPYYVIPKCLF